jgi:hypothetical protein
MIHLKNYKRFLESYLVSTNYTQITNIDIDLNESLNLFYENILKSIGAEESDLFKSFNLPVDDFKNKIDLDSLSDNIAFINSLSSIGLKKSYLQSTDDLETFVNKPCRFLMIYRIEANELENPDYILFQSWNDTLDKWEDTKLYKISGDIKSFYDKLASKVIEIIHDGESYIYQSSNKNEWELQNLDKENDRFKKYFRKVEFEKFINDNKFKFDIK